jgi:hypothetical protein
MPLGHHHDTVPAQTAVDANGNPVQVQQMSHLEAIKAREQQIKADEKLYVLTPAILAPKSALHC